MKVFAGAEHRRHRPRTEIVYGQAVPAYEVPERVDAILAGVGRGHETLEPADHGRPALEAVHDPGYLDHLETAWADWTADGHQEPLVADTFPLPPMGAGPSPASAEARAGYYVFDASTPILDGTYVAARSAANCALSAAEAVLAGDRTAYALCRPPGHHAGRRFGGGYCYLNNAAVATAALRRTAGRVGILDLDYHHGNGTQQIFWEEPAVPYASLHADPDVEYPYYTGRAEETGSGHGAGTTRNTPLPLGTGDGPFLAAAREAAGWLAERGIEVLVVSLGLDAFEGDPVGRFALTEGCFRRLGETVREIDVPAVVVQEGGYAVEALGRLAAAFLGGLEGQPSKA